MLLLSAYTGPLERAMEVCLQVSGDVEGYKRAIAILDQEYGNKKYTMELNGKVRRGLDVTLDHLKSLSNMVQQLMELSVGHGETEREQNRGTMKQLIDAIHADRIPYPEYEEKTDKTWYLPHHLVLNPKKSEKSRNNV